MNAWAHKPLGELCSIKTGKKDVNEGSPNGAYPFFTCAKKVHASNTYSFDTEAILIAGNGVVGETKLYRGKFEAYQRTYVLDGFQEDLDFIFYVLRGSLMTELNKVVSGSTMPYIRKGDLDHFPVPLPPLPEQKKIAHILSTVQRAIEAQERIIQTTTELFKSMLHQLMTAQINTSGGPRVEKVSEGDRGMAIWETCTIPNSLIKSKVGRQNQIPAKDITDVGQYPVVDQGQEFIAGYCNDASKLVIFDLPLIIFGDHTRCFKYVDFPFVLGADGTKVLMPNQELYDPKFYYYALLALKLPNRGYNRHFKSLKGRSIPLPPISEQKRIAYILSTVQEKIDKAHAKKSKLQDLFRTLLHELMTAKTRIHELSLAVQNA